MKRFFLLLNLPSINIFQSGNFRPNFGKLRLGTLEKPPSANIYLPFSVKFETHLRLTYITRKLVVSSTITRIHFTTLNDSFNRRKNYLVLYIKLSHKAVKTFNIGLNVFRSIHSKVLSDSFQKTIPTRNIRTQFVLNYDESEQTYNNDEETLFYTLFMETNVGETYLIVEKREKFINIPMFNRHFSNDCDEKMC